MSRTKRSKLATQFYFRYPKTFQEIRENHGAEIDGVKVRRVGKRRRPPTSWDDVTTAAAYEKPKNKVPKHWSRY